MQQILDLWSSDGWMFPCLNKQLLGIDCPGCGLQRAFVALLKGNLPGSLKMYPALIPLLLLFGTVVVDQFRPTKLGHSMTKWLLIVSGGLILGNYTLKMIF